MGLSFTVLLVALSLGLGVYNLILAKQSKAQSKSKAESLDSLLLECAREVDFNFAKLEEMQALLDRQAKFLADIAVILGDDLIRRD